MKEELIFNRSDGTCEFGKVSYTMRKNGDWFGAFCKSYPQFSRILDDTDILGVSSHPYASSIPLMNEKEAIMPVSIQ